MLSKVDLTASFVDPQYPDLAVLVAGILNIWPEHERYLRKSMKIRDEGLLAFSDHLAGVVRRLAAASPDGPDQLARDYRFICQDIVLPEEIHFRRHKRYRLTTFEEALATVYQDQPFMTRYMNGLLVTDVLWINHCQCMQHYRDVFLRSLPQDADVLEIGPGHGLLLKLALDAGLSRLHAWDVSDASLDLSRHTLATFGQASNVVFSKRNVFEPFILAKENQGLFDAVVFSEVLEHLEHPRLALEAIAHILKPGGRVWVNVPANSPAPDHLFLVRNPQEAADVVASAGFEVIDRASFPMTGVTLERAIDQDLTISCVVVGQKPRQ